MTPQETEQAVEKHFSRQASSLCTFADSTSQNGSNLWIRRFEVDVGRDLLVMIREQDLGKSSQPAARLAVAHVTLYAPNIQGRGTGALAEEVLLNPHHFLCVTSLSSELGTLLKCKSFQIEW